MTKDYRRHFPWIAPKDMEPQECSICGDKSHFWYRMRFTKAKKDWVHNICERCYQNGR